MPNIRSAKKRVRVITKKTLYNKAVRSDLRTAVKKAELALADNSEGKAEAVKSAMIKLDRAVNKGVLHKNTAARKKSQLALKLNRA